MTQSKSVKQHDQGLTPKAGEFLIGNDLRVTRLGFGAMRITGNGIWGEPAEVGPQTGPNEHPPCYPT
jgi:hypothetical protein